jgi:FKBP-type peptidyl-prolyl cis-trans isomerase
MNVTSTGIAVALAVVIALGFLFFGSAVFTPFVTPTTSEQALVPIAMDSASSTPEIPQELPNELTGLELAQGSGQEVVAGSRVSVNYTGMLPDGTVFDTSANRGPFQFTVGEGRVIAGWEQGLMGMKEGGKRRLIIPPSLAYGEQGVPGAIPPNATLIFDIELLDVQ